MFRCLRDPTNKLNPIIYSFLLKPMTPNPQALVRTRPDETPPSNQPATSNLGRFFELVTQACDLGSRTDPKSTNYTRLPVDQMFAEGALEVLRGIAEEHEAMGIATVDQVRSHLPRLTFFLEAGIELAGGPEAAARDFLGRAHPQIERRAFVLSSKSRTVSTKDLWGEAVAGFLRSLVDSVRVRATEVLEAAKRLKRENRGVIREKAVSSDYLGGSESLRIASSWNQEWIFRTTSTAEGALGEEPLNSAGRFLVNGARKITLMRHGLSAARKLTASYLGVNLPAEVRSAAETDEDMENVLSNHLANFLLGVERPYLTADQVREVEGVCRQRMDKINEIGAEFRAHLVEKFGLTAEETEAIEADINSALSRLFRGPANNMNTLLYHPFQDEGLKRLEDRLRGMGAEDKQAVDAAQIICMPTSLDTFHDGKKTTGDLLHSIEGYPTIVKLLFIEKYALPEDQEGLYFQCAKLENLNAVSLAFLREKIDIDDPSLKHSVRILLLRTDLEPQEHASRVLTMLTNRIEQISDTGSKGDKELILIKKLIQLLDEMEEGEVEAFFEAHRKVCIALLGEVEISRIKFDLTELRERAPHVWEKIGLGRHLGFRNGDFEDAKLIDTHVSTGKLLAPWDHMITGERTDDELGSHGLEIAFFDGGRERIAQLMAQYSEQDIFYWVHEGERDIDEQWEAYMEKQNAYFAELKRLLAEK